MLYYGMTEEELLEIEEAKGLGVSVRRGGRRLRQQL